MMQKDDDKDVKLGHVEIASVADASPQDVKSLLAQIEGLQAQLAESEEKRTVAQQAALEAAQAQGMLMQREIHEVPSGKKISVPHLKRYKVVGHKDDGREILKPVFQQVEVETYYYKIDLPPCGGTHMTVNGNELYHGVVVECDVDSLRSIKDMVFRCWKHDAEIHGSDENAYRKPTNRTLSGAGRR
jgi:hypothetical protein